MAWTLFQKPEEETDAWSGFIEQGVRVEGRLELAGVFRIDGQVEGTILSERGLILGENARVAGEIHGNHVSIEGRFKGVIFATGRVEIHAKAVVSGEIHTPCLVLESGGIFDGNCHMLTPAPAAKTIAIPIRSGTQG
jgi:cytoskeletal protein CcmA (bactofilin family)